LKTDSRDENTQKAIIDMWQETCEKGGTVIFKIVTASMSPLIEMDDTVRIGRVEACKVRIGDILAYRDGQNVVVHRIIDRIRSNREVRFLQRSDTGGPCGEITVDNIIGRVLSIQKGEREISLNTTWSRIKGRILGWRGWLWNRLNLKRTGLIGNIMRQSLIPVWRLGRYILFWRT
jgi:hypothetical protein